MYLGLEYIYHLLKNLKLIFLQSYWNAVCKLHSNKIAGILILGSSVDDKYTPDQDTLFLSFIVEVLSHQIDRLIEDRD